MRSTELAVAGATPLFALGSDRAPYFWPLLGWLLAVFIAGRFTVRPLARLATRATLQRDLIVAATEAERARLAADIHDDALQELTLLVRRLEASGDTEGAEIGRTVADRLRAICGDLRLPILDDLGVGPGPRLARPPDRAARRRGGPPRAVRRRAPQPRRRAGDLPGRPGGAGERGQARQAADRRPLPLDRGRDLARDRRRRARDHGGGRRRRRAAGRFGLLNMAQRAEQIGAILDIKRWPTGGTHVALEWRRPLTVSPAIRRSRRR